MTKVLSRARPRVHALDGLGLSACLFSGVAAQEPPIWTVTEVEAKYPEPFDNLRGAQQLRDGRLIVLDYGFFVVNVTRGTRAPLSRSGNGPGEYVAPVLLFAVRGDTTAYLDIARPRKVLFILPSGEFRGNYDFRGGVHVRDPQAADDRGRLYAQYRRSRGPKVVRDSTDIIRIDRKTGRSDTVAALMERWPVTSIPIGVNGSLPPFATFEQWVVSRDGRVAVVSVEPYRVTLSDESGRRIAGPLIPVEPVRVTEAHRSAWLEKAMEARLVITSASTNPRVEFRPRTRTEVEPRTWPQFLPPFLPGAASFAPDGMLWVLRTTPDPSLPIVDVIDRRGILVGRLAFPRGRKLLCHGTDGVYLIRVDEDGLQYIERYRLPAGYGEAVSR